MSDGAIIALIGLATVVVAGVPATVTALLSRRVVVEARDHAQSAADVAAETQATIGVANGNGNVMTQLAALDSKINEVNAKLEDRTHVTRFGHTEPESLATYMQDRMHYVINTQTVIKGMLDLLWHAARHEGWELPELPSIENPPAPQSGG